MIKGHDGRAAVLRALEQSGLSMAEFCRRRGLPYATVVSWRGAARRAAGRFVEVETPAAAEPGPAWRNPGAALCAEVVLPGGTVLRVYQLSDQGGAR